jgi:hypothetical protein
MISSKELLDKMNKAGFKGSKRERVEWDTDEEDRPSPRVYYEDWDNRRLIEWILKQINQ